MATGSIFRSAVAAALISVSPILVPAVTGQIAPAEAAVNVSISFDTFYNGMSDYGDWVFYQGAYIWVPTSVGPDWRPYTLGHWVWTNEYGWMWVSDEPFGWAAYHYGRWGYSNDFGWYWVPGQRWAPAWVSWRNSGDIVGWAPLPPEYDDNSVNINININILPDYYWNVVPTRRFLAPDLSAALVFNAGERRRLFQGGARGGNVVIQNNVVVNNFINVNYISKQTGQKVRPVRLVKSDRPGSARMQGDQVTAFVGNVGGNKNVKPAKITDVNNVKMSVKDRVNRGKPVKEMGLPNAGSVQNGINAGQGGQNGLNGAGQANTGNKKLEKLNKKNGAAQGGQTTGTDMNNQPGAATGQGTVPGTDKTKNKKKKLPVETMQPNGTDNGQMQSGDNGQGAATGQTPTKKNKKKPVQPPAMDMNGQGAGVDQGGGTPMPPKKNKKNNGDFMQQNGGGYQGDQMNGGNPMPPKKNKKNNGDFMQQNGGGYQGDQMNGGNPMPPKNNKKNNGDFMQQNGGGYQGDQMNGGNGQNLRNQNQQPPKGKSKKCDPQVDPNCQ